MKKKKLAPPKVDRSRIAVKTSPIHGKGVFVVKPIKKGAVIIEYKGERISWKKAEKRHPHDPKDPNHTFYFSLEDGRVIDAKYGGNAARWINHSCKPCCETQEESYDGKPRVFVYALRNLRPGEELFYDYSLGVEGRVTKKMKKDYECRCGAKKCRRTMLAIKEK
ncbi:SET domain-containing protein [Polynucleobacter paneuropaeus]|nr:SET domain-containing protein [Polynucleobacter paneuropaeus]MBT8611539.1 SET domain-containing protein [Polynucleobacter paneuropaeus]